MVVVLFDLDWKVTRSLVSYALDSKFFNSCSSIERSPDHWWVTPLHPTTTVLQNLLKGHQIIGELRPSVKAEVSADKQLKGHQIIGELRLTTSGSPFSPCWLKGHQIIGELRPWTSRGTANLTILKGHQIIGELRLMQHYPQLGLLIERSPDHWWVTP